MEKIPDQRKANRNKSFRHKIALLDQNIGTQFRDGIYHKIVKSSYFDSMIL